MQQLYGANDWVYMYMQFDVKATLDQMLLGCILVLIASFVVT